MRGHIPAELKNKLQLHWRFTVTPWDPEMNGSPCTAR